MAKSIRYGSYCIPQEQVSSSSPLNKFHLDGDCREKLGGNNTLTISSYVSGLSTITANTTYAIAFDFMAARVLELEEGSMVLLSLDSGDTFPIRLLKGECFASKVASTARMKINICTATDGSGTGIGKVEFWGAQE